jgi:chorismate dehydratase
MGIGVGVESPAGTRPRLCAVRYLNTTPLVWGFLHGPERDLATVDFDVPSACADSVRAGRADAGLLPVVEIARQQLPVLADVGIACHGAVRSILVVCKRPIRDIQTLAADTSSRTSVMLTRIVLSQRYGVEPRFLPMAPDLDHMLTKADAALIIGDPALAIDPARLAYPALDLGEEWWNLTGLPMVFAEWAGRAAIPCSVFRQSYESGMINLDQYIALEASRRGIPEPLAREYLNRYIRFEIGPAERRGRDEYLRLASALETIPA